MTDSAVFYAAEVTCYRPGAATLTVSEGHGTAPYGALTQFADDLESTATLYASDFGYRTAPSDPGGPLAYPPLLADAFQVSVALNLAPSQSAAAAAWGTISLANPDGQLNGTAAALNCDGRPVTIRMGQKTYEGFLGPRTNRSTPGTYIAADGTMQTAAAGVVRVDYSSGSPVVLDEVAAENYFTAANTTLPSTINIAASVNTLPVGPDVPAPLFAGADVFCFTIGGDTTLDTSFYWQSSSASPTFPRGVQPARLSLWLWFPPGTANISDAYLSADGGHPVYAGAGRLGQWFRLTTYCLAADTGNPRILFRPNPQARTGVPVGTTFFATCPQIEVYTGAPPTSYIPTVGAVETRAADNLYTSRGIYLDPPIASLSVAFSGVATSWFLSDTALQIPLRDATYWMEQPFQTTLYLGTGSYAGTADLAQKPQPKTRGGTTASPVCNITPVLMDPTNRIYQYNDGPGTVVNLYEGGAKTITFSADTTDLYSGSTPAGQYRTDNSKGLFQLGSNPAHAITADVTGAFPVAGAKTTVCSIAQFMLSEDISVPAANIDTASFVAADTAYPYVGGVYFDSSQTIDGVDALEAVLSALGAKLVPFKDGTLRLLVLRALPSTAVATATFSTDNVVTLTPQPLPSDLDPPPFRLRVGYNHNYTVQTTDINTATATAAQQQFIASADRYAAWSSGTVLTAYRRPNDPDPITGALLSQTDAQTVASDLGALWGVRRRVYNAVVPLSVAMARDIGDVVNVIFPMDDLGSGKLGQIVGYTFNSGDATVTFQVLV